MNELLTINYDSERPTVSGRDLHRALGIGTKYADWFKRMCEYGFCEGNDYLSCFSNLGSEMHGGQNKVDHQLTIDMAKQLCMIQRTNIGRKFREYFIKVEEAWNSPDAVMARALQIANRTIDNLMHRNGELECTVAIQNQQIAEMSPKASYYDIVLQCPDVVPISVIAKDYGWSAKHMNKYLEQNGVQYKQGNIWLLYQGYADKGYTNTKTFATPAGDGTLHNHVHTYWTQAGRLFIYNLLRAGGIVPCIEQEV